MKKNCWEHKNCGREPGGRNVMELGICPVTIKISFHGTNNGVNGGRSCWVIAGSLCGGEVQGTYSQKLGNCMICDFYAMVVLQEGSEYESTKKIQERMKLAKVA